jgi:hypothetical protein
MQKDQFVDKGILKYEFVKQTLMNYCEYDNFKNIFAVDIKKLLE